MTTFCFVSKYHDNKPGSVHIESSDDSRCMCGYTHPMLGGANCMTAADVTAAVVSDADGYLCARCVKSFNKRHAKPTG